MKRALITGIAGSGGSHLAEYLVDNEDVEVHGISRWHSTTSNSNLKRISKDIIRNDLSFIKRDEFFYLEHKENK